jgi:hypothetical protein
MDARRVAMRRAAYIDELVAARDMHAGSIPAWNMRRPSCAAKSDNDRVRALIVTRIRGGAPDATR